MTLPSRYILLKQAKHCCVHTYYRTRTSKVIIVCIVLVILSILCPKCIVCHWQHDLSVSLPMQTQSPSGKSGADSKSKSSPVSALHMWGGNTGAGVKLKD